MLRSLFENNPGKGAKKRKRNFWLYSVGEFVLIFLGILIALQVENLNENRKDRKLEHVLLSEMLSNLKSDLDGIEFNLAKSQHFIRSYEIIISYMSTDMEWNDSLEYHFSQMNGATLIHINSATYESLMSIGIDIVSNDSIRQKITYLHSAIYTYVSKVEEQSVKNLVENVSRTMKENLDLIENLERARPLDPVGIKKNNLFKGEVIAGMTLLQYQINAYNRAKSEIVALISMLENELGIIP